MTVIAVRKLDKAISQALQEWLAPHDFVAADGGRGALAGQPLRLYRCGS